MNAVASYLVKFRLLFERKIINCNRKVIYCEHLFPSNDLYGQLETIYACVITATVHLTFILKSK